MAENETGGVRYDLKGQTTPQRDFSRRLQFEEQPEFASLSDIIEFNMYNQGVLQTPKDFGAQRDLLLKQLKQGFYGSLQTRTGRLTDRGALVDTLPTINSSKELRELLSSTKLVPQGLLHIRNSELKALAKQHPSVKKTYSPDAIAALGDLKTHVDSQGWLASKISVTTDGNELAANLSSNGSNIRLTLGTPRLSRYSNAITMNHSLVSIQSLRGSQTNDITKTNVRDILYPVLDYTMGVSVDEIVRDVVNPVTGVAEKGRTILGITSKKNLAASKTAIALGRQVIDEQATLAAYKKAKSKANFKAVYRADVGPTEYGQVYTGNRDQVRITGIPRLTFHKYKYTAQFSIDNLHVKSKAYQQQREQKESMTFLDLLKQVVDTAVSDGVSDLNSIDDWLDEDGAIDYDKVNMNYVVNYGGFENALRLLTNTVENNAKLAAVNENYDFSVEKFRNQLMLRDINDDTEVEDDDVAAIGDTDDSDLTVEGSRQRLANALVGIGQSKLDLDSIADEKLKQQYIDMIDLVEKTAKEHQIINFEAYYDTDNVLHWSGDQFNPLTDATNIRDAYDHVENKLGQFFFENSQGYVDVQKGSQLEPEMRVPTYEMNLVPGSASRDNGKSLYKTNYNNTLLSRVRLLAPRQLMHDKVVSIVRGQMINNVSTNKNLSDDTLYDATRMNTIYRNMSPLTEAELQRPGTVKQKAARVRLGAGFLDRALELRAIEPTDYDAAQAILENSQNPYTVAQNVRLPLRGLEGFVDNEASSDGKVLGLVMYLTEPAMDFIEQHGDHLYTGQALKDMSFNEHGSLGQEGYIAVNAIGKANLVKHPDLEMVSEVIDGKATEYVPTALQKYFVEAPEDVLLEYGISREDVTHDVLERHQAYLNGETRISKNGYEVEPLPIPEYDVLTPADQAGARGQKVIDEEVNRQIRRYYGTVYSARHVRRDDTGQIIRDENGNAQYDSLLPFGKYDSPDRKLMTINQLQVAKEVIGGSLDSDGREKPIVSLQTVGGLTFEDGIVVSQKFAQEHGLKIGDKLADMHANKGTISYISGFPKPDVLTKDIPDSYVYNAEAEAFFANNPDVDIVQSPYSVATRANMGVVKEMQAGKHTPLKDNNGQPLLNADGEVLYAGQLAIVVTNMTADHKVKLYDIQKNLAKSRRFSQQQVYAVQAHGATNVLKEVFNEFDNENVLRKLDHYYNAMGYHVNEDGLLVSGHRDMDVDMLPASDGTLVRTEVPNDNALVLTADVASEYLGQQASYIQLPVMIGAGEDNLQTQYLSVLPERLRRDSESFDGVYQKHDYQARLDQPDGIINDAVRVGDLKVEEIIETKAMSYSEAEIRQLYADHDESFMHNLAIYQPKDENVRLAEEALTRKVSDYQEVIASEKFGFDDAAVKKSFVRRNVVSRELRHSATSIVTNRSQLPLEQIAMSPALAANLGLVEAIDQAKVDEAVATGDMSKIQDAYRNNWQYKYYAEGGDTRDLKVMAWRDPILHDGSVAAFGYSVDDTISGMAINPIVSKSFGLDFDGDQMGLWTSLRPEVQQDFVEKMDVKQNLRDADNNLQLNIGMDIIDNFTNSKVGQGFLQKMKDEYTQANTQIKQVITRDLKNGLSEQGLALRYPADVIMQYKTNPDDIKVTAKDAISAELNGYDVWTYETNNFKKIHKAGILEVQDDKAKLDALNDMRVAGSLPKSSLSDFEKLDEADPNFEKYSKLFRVQDKIKTLRAKGMSQEDVADSLSAEEASLSGEYNEKLASAVRLSNEEITERINNLSKNFLSNESSGSPRVLDFVTDERVETTLNNMVDNGAKGNPGSVNRAMKYLTNGVTPDDMVQVRQAMGDKVDLTGQAGAQFLRLAPLMMGENDVNNIVDGLNGARRSLDVTEQPTDAVLQIKHDPAKTPVVREFLNQSRKFSIGPQVGHEGEPVIVRIPTESKPIAAEHVSFGAIAQDFVKSGILYGMSEQDMLKLGKDLDTVNKVAVAKNSESRGYGSEQYTSSLAVDINLGSYGVDSKFDTDLGYSVVGSANGKNGAPNKSNPQALYALALKGTYEAMGLDISPVSVDAVQTAVRAKDTKLLIPYDTNLVKKAGTLEMIATKGFDGVQKTAQINDKFVKDNQELEKSGKEIKSFAEAKALGFGDLSAIYVPKDITLVYQQNAQEMHDGKDIYRESLEAERERKAEIELQKQAALDLEINDVSDKVNSLFDSEMKNAQIKDVQAKVIDLTTNSLKNDGASVGPDVVDDARGRGNQRDQDEAEANEKLSVSAKLENTVLRPSQPAKSKTIHKKDNFEMDF